MQPFGLQNLPIAQPFQTGVPWEYIRLRNESDNELIVSLSGAGGGSLGAWMQDDFFVGNRNFTGQVNVTINPSVTAAGAGYVACDAYSDGELRHPGPVQLTRAVSVTGGALNTLSNEGSAAGVQVIDAGDKAFSQLFTLFNDGHGVWKVDQSGVAHSVITVQASGTPLILGLSGDITQVNGKLSVQQQMNISQIFELTGNNLALDLSAGDGSIAYPQQQKPNQVGTPVNGTSGTVAFDTPVWGNGLKIFLLNFQGYINNVAVTFTLPTTVSRGFFKVGNFGNAVTAFHFVKAAANTTCNVITALASAGGTVNPQTSIFQNSIGSIATSATDSVTIDATTTAISSEIFFIGV